MTDTITYLSKFLLGTRIGFDLIDVVNVKDYGAVGDGAHNDGAAIQAAFNAAYALPTGNTVDWLNKGVYIPHGTYLVEQELHVSPGGSFANGNGVWVFGDGQRNTRLLYTGPDSKQFYGVTALLTTQHLNYSQIQGITFDVTNSNSTVGVHLADVPPGTNGGTGVSWIDCGFIGATAFGFVADMASLGSEQLFYGCTFANCDGTAASLTDAQGNHIGGGLCTASQNALDHTVIGCSFINNCIGIVCPSGGVKLVKGCNFRNSARLDIWNKGESCVIEGCHSASPTFLCVGPAWIIGCIHNTSGVGTFYDGTGTYFANDMPWITVDGCYSTNSKFLSHTNGSAKLYLKGNTFNRSDYLTDWINPGGNTTYIDDVLQ